MNFKKLKAKFQPSDQWRYLPSNIDIHKQTWISFRNIRCDSKTYWKLVENFKQLLSHLDTSVLNVRTYVCM